MTLGREWGPFPGGGGDHDAAATPAHEEIRRSVRTTCIAVGTLACRRCDAPVALGGAPLSPADNLTCPYCEHQGPAREFLSLAPPTRRTRVVVRVTRDARRMKLRLAAAPPDPGR